MKLFNLFFTAAFVILASPLQETALAQEVAAVAVAASEGLPWYASNWFEIVMSILVTGALPLLHWFLKLKWEAYRKSNIGELALTIVQSYWGSTIKGINAMKLGGISTSETRELKEKAMSDAIKSFTGALGGTTKAAKALGVGVGSVDVVARGLLETAVSNSKNAGKKARATPSGN